MTLIERYARLVDRLLVELKLLYGPRLAAVAVFGSVGRGTPREDSDVDLLIVARDLPQGRFRRVEEFLPVEARLDSALRDTSASGIPVMLSAVFKTPAEMERGSPLFLDMLDDAQVLYDPERLLSEHLEGFRRRLEALGARRIWRGNAWYWELKPDLKPGEVFSL